MPMLLTGRPRGADILSRWENHNVSYRRKFPHQPALAGRLSVAVLRDLPARGRARPSESLLCVHPLLPALHARTDRRLDEAPQPPRLRRVRQRSARLRAADRLGRRGAAALSVQHAGRPARERGHAGGLLSRFLFLRAQAVRAFYGHRRPAHDREHPGHPLAHAAHRRGVHLRGRHPRRRGGGHAGRRPAADSLQHPGLPDVPLNFQPKSPRRSRGLFFGSIPQNGGGKSGIYRIIASVRLYLSRQL